MGSLTRGRVYDVASSDPEARAIRLMDDRGRLRQFPNSLFLHGEVNLPRIVEIHIDHADGDAATEVMVDLSDGERRLLWFATPEQLARFGDYLPGTDTRFHIDNRCLCITSRLDDETVRKVVTHAWHQGLLEACSIRLVPNHDGE